VTITHLDGCALSTEWSSPVPIPRAGPETVSGHGADRKTPLAGLVAVKRQPGTAQAGRTGTVLPHGRTAVKELNNAPLNHLSRSTRGSHVVPAVNGLLFLPTNATIIAAVSFGVGPPGSGASWSTTPGCSRT
jgi:hypothetical protein